MNVTVDVTNFPPLTPSGNFKIEFNFSANNSKWYYALKVFGYVRNPNWHQL
jgi:hypothetical protein